MCSEGALEMPKFRVKGCLKENAEDVELIIEAASYKDAERIANQKGILVSDVLTVEETAQKQHEPSVTLTAPPESKKKSKKDIIIACVMIVIGLGCVLISQVILTGDSSSSELYTGFWIRMFGWGLVGFGLIFWTLARLKLYFKHDN